MSTLLLVALAFVEGWSVLTLELLAGQMLAPGFGDSTATWMWILIASMLGLALGYATAHRCVQDVGHERRASALLVGGLCYVAIVPVWCDTLLAGLIGDPGHLSLAAASASIVVVPMVLFGMVPGLLVAASADGVSATQPAPGRVFAASTVGGMSGGLLVGLVLVPALGVTYAVRCVSGAMLVLPVLVLLRGGAWRYSGVAVACWLASICAPRSVVSTTGNQRLLDYEEGIQGQIAVVESPHGAGGVMRALYVNRMTQTVGVQGAPFRVSETLPYVRDAAPVIASYPRGSDALALGLGGGSASQLMHKLGFNVTVVDLDPRMIRVAQQYFESPADADYVVDDARRYIRRAGRMFDVVVFDTYRGEHPPTHVVTLESMRELGAALRPEGVAIFNVAGRVDSKESETVRSMVKTIRAAGFECRIICNDRALNTVLVVDRGGQEFKVGDATVATELGMAQAPAFFDDRSLSYGHARVFTDDLPVLDLLYRSDARAFRRAINRDYRNRRPREVIPLYR